MDGPIRLLFNGPTERNVLALMQQLGLSLVDFRGWTQQAEFEIGDTPADSLRYIAAGPDSFHEFRTTHNAADRKFNGIWELEWDRSSDKAHVLDFHAVEIRPKLAPRPSEA